MSPAKWTREDAVTLAGVAGTERVREMEVAHVLGVVVAGHDERVQPRIEERVEVATRRAELVGVALGGEIATYHHQVGVQRGHFLDARREELAVEVGRAAVQVGELSDHERLAGHCPEVYGNVGFRSWASAPGCCGG